MNELLNNIIGTSLLLLITSYVVNYIFIPEDRSQMSGMHAFIAVLSVFIPLVIFIVSSLIRIWK